jgi:hypothetical protein
MTTMNVFIQVYDPALCCSTGVCGADVDQALVSFSADMAWAQKNGVQIERFNLANEPQAFAENQTVKSFLERLGEEALPLILIDGEVVVTGRYPTRAELAGWASITLPADEPKQTGSCGSGKSCCC